MNKTPAEIGSTFGFLAKSQNGSNQTDDFTFPVEALTFNPSVFRVFPAKFTQDDVVTFYLDKKKLDTAAKRTLVDSAVYVYTDINYTKPDGSGGFFQPSMFCNNGVPEYTGQVGVGNNPDLKATDLGGGLWGWTILPSIFYKIGDASNPAYPPAGSKITSIKVHFRTRDSDYCSGGHGATDYDDVSTAPVTQ
jgi:hypothetical protein